MCNEYEQVLFRPQGEGYPPSPFTIGEVEFYEAAGRSLNPTVVDRLLRQLNAHSRVTSLHVRRVADFGASTAQYAGLPNYAVLGLRNAFLLHDIGKLVIPVKMLDSPDVLNNTEMKIFRNHVLAGDAIIAAQNDLPEIFRALAREVIMGHHEHYRGGQGYPLGLAGKSIPASARLAAVVDVLDAVAHRGIYQPAIGIAATLQEMQNPDNVRMQNKLDPAMVRLVVNALQPQQAQRPHLLPEIRPLGSRLDTARV